MCKVFDKHDNDDDDNGQSSRAFCSGGRNVLHADDRTRCSFSAKSCFYCLIKTQLAWRRELSVKFQIFSEHNTSNINHKHGHEFQS